MKRKHILLILFFLFFAGAIIYSLSKPDFQAWLRTADAPIVAALNRGTQACNDGDFVRAEKEYAHAEQLAAAADVSANEKWLARDTADTAWKDQADIVKPRARFLAGKDRGLYRGGMHYFKNRISEAAYGLALAHYQKLRFKYRLGDSRSFAPPESEIAPALSALERGLAVCPQSESLRLLKGEILAAAGRYPQALKTLEEILLIDPQSAEAYNQMGLIYSSRIFLIDSASWKENQKKALEMFTKATLGTTLDGGRLPDPLFNLGAYYAAPDASRPESAAPAPADAALARKYLNAYIDLVKDDEAPTVQQARKILERLSQKMAK